MKKAIIVCLLVAVLFVFGCKGVGEAIAGTRDICCCRVKPPVRGQLEHFSVCVPPEYKIATELGANETVNVDAEKCSYFCKKIDNLGK